MKKVAIIGANSYIARNMICFLSNNEDIELYLYGKEEQQTDGKTPYVQVCLSDLESVKMIDFNVNLIYMFVGKTGSSAGFDDPDEFIDVNEKFLLHVLNEYHRQKSNAKLIFPSTRLVYQAKDGKQREDSVKCFKTIYSINKFACEKYLEMYNNVFGLKYCILRICVPYGSIIENAYSYGTVDFMLRKSKKGENINLYGNGTQRRTLTYIEDLCKILMMVGYSECCINDVYNVGGEDYSLKEIAEEIAACYGVKVEYIPWPDVEKKIESGNTVFDSKKLDNLINWSSYQSFKEWIKQQKGLIK